MLQYVDTTLVSGKRRERSKKKKMKKREKVENALAKPWCFYLSTQFMEVEPVEKSAQSENSIQVNSVEISCAMRERKHRVEIGEKKGIW